MKKNLTGILLVSNTLWLRGNEFTFELRKEREKNLQPWNIAEEDSNTKSENRGYKDIDILRWRVVEHAQSAASSCEQVTNKDDIKRRKKEHSHLQKERTPIASGPR